ncbi:SulP family inorganic anion transporter [Jiulongibacter sp. NS-SX5]|uniref:SulP family inorganic anion transporter n=1 Tax=Jiulongibacter sp. NS-SX5 TaxID=3463854 RepID=UPI0040598AE8
MTKEFTFKHIGKDFSAGVVVFLVALPLCLGISLASDAPLFSGIIAGIVGGIVVGLISGSRLGVSGPAAGLAVIVANAIGSFPSYELFLAAVVLGGAIQLVLGFIGAGKIAFYFPSSVIKGMLAAIGLTIILKQIPHAFGIDRDPEGDFKFLQSDGENTFSELLNLNNFTEGALLIGLICLGILILWERKFIKENKVLGFIPGPLLAVVAGVVISYFFPENLALSEDHLVQIPISGSIEDFVGLFTFPDFRGLASFAVIKTGFLIAIIASLETLLCVEATDRLDPRKNITPTNRELVAQGVGNMFSGLIGGIPVTQVIVRSSANIQAGGRTKMSAVIHGFLLMFCVILIPDILNMIPLSALAAVLLVVGYKLAKPETFKRMWAEGQDQFIPFVVTIIAVLFTDLLVGILIGLLVGIGYVLYTNFRSALKLSKSGNHMTIDFKKDVFFYNRAELMKALSTLEEGDELTLDGRNVDFMDHDIFLAIEDFVRDAQKKNIKVNVLDITRKKITFGKNEETIELNN